ncbi:uncharacterized protein C12orf29 homolog [Nematolebias whitei]|uniref:uncharacterized protein C12orf29 homolog n=1 Tax=Nematolebias whitei TaxID=451745 RepID=UPI0018980CDC|nr:uncharacterized protein C12orf29 homolog [Nematolebias whitei]
MKMRRLGSVQQKIPCVFLTEVKEEASRKRDRQQFQVVATENVNPVAVEANVNCARATEKLDGTCCYVGLYQGQPYLWARLDRRPNKPAEKRFKKHQRSQTNYKDFVWNVEEDFKSVPETWIPAHRVKHHDGHPIPDEHGHIPGWVPVENNNKQYCWHSSVVDYDVGTALVLRPSSDEEDVLEVTAVPLAEIQEQTLELIGTNVNGNPYGLGSKKQPIHLLVPHGIISIRNPSSVDFQQLCSWFQESPEGQVEGIVWHCDNGSLVKVHRHHMGLRWPDGDPCLARRPVVIRVDGTVDAYNSKSLFTSFFKLNGHLFRQLQDVQFES